MKVGIRMIILNGSSRENGNTEQLVNILVDGIDHEMINLREYSIQPINDQRHVEGGFTPINDDYYNIIEKVLNAETIVFATPVYWYGMSGVLKDFVDRFSQLLRDSNLNFKERIKNKKMIVVTVGGDNPKIKALPLIQQFEYIFNFIGASFDSYIIGAGNAPGEVLQDEQAVEQAKQLNRKMK
jgi:multimeric flavodoxin WrbA